MAAVNDKAFLARKVISADGPSPDEVNHEGSLLEWCATRIEPEEESNRRRSVLERINNIVRVWIRHTMISEFRMPEAAAAQVEGRIFATGSYRYNVHTSGSDIDMVLIAPSRITREHFFDTLAPRLKSEPWVTELHCIRESRVPIIAMVCDGIDIDLSFGSIRQDRVPEVITDDLLQGLDEQSVLSCNAVRVAHNIMDLVPSKATFRQTLRFVKAWGKARGVYSNTFGFPSGIGWAILVAFVCQCYPRQNAAGMVARFFRTYHAWFKPNPHESGQENRAIYLTESMRAKTNLGRCWDPRESKSDAMALFPVLTPALPYGNACYNVTLTNLKQLCDEFKRGYDIVSGSLTMSADDARAAYGPYGVWSKLLDAVTFFGEYPHYLHVEVACSDAEQYQAYVDGVESRIRILWAGNASSRGQTLEDYKQLRLHLHPRRFEDPDEVERRVRVLQAKPSSTRPSGTVSGRASSHADVNSPRGSTSAVGGAGGGATWYTAHYFIGMTVNTKGGGSQKIDLAPAIRTFHSVVRQLRQYVEGVTKLPAVSVCDISGVPQFVKLAAGYRPPVAGVSGGGASESGEARRGSVPSSAGSVRGAETASSANGAARSGAGASSSSSVSASLRSAGGVSGEVAGSGKSTPPVGGDGGAVTPVPAVGGGRAKRPREATVAEDSLEQDLGLDF